MAELRATPQNRLLGQLANMLRTTEGDIAAPEFLPRGLDVMGLVRQLMLPSAETVEKLSYGDPLFRMPTQSNIPITADREYLADVVGMAPMVPAASRATTRLSNEAADRLVQMITRNPEATAPQVLEEAAMPLMSAIVPRQVATEFKMPTTLPQSDEFVSAVQNTPGAEITPDGLVMRVQRMQKPEQAGEESVRTGVFYLPEGSASMKYYKGKDSSYGGSQPISGETLYKNPLFVKGATGGKAPEKAYDLILGKGAYEQMRKDALRVRHPELISDKRYNLSDAITPEQFLAKYAPDLEGYGDYIFRGSRQGNQLAYALQEAAVAQKVRDAGYDAVLGYSKKKTGDPFLSEVFDVREATYPTPEGGFTLRPEFAGLLDQPAQSVEKVYHGTSPKAAQQIEQSGFDITKSADGSVWFTSNPEIGEVAATGKGAIVERLVDLNDLKLGGWSETDRFSTDELIQQGYDGLRLVDNGQVTYQIFNPEKLKKPIKETVVK